MMNFVIARATFYRKEFFPFYERSNLLIFLKTLYNIYMILYLFICFLFLKYIHKCLTEIIL